ncbi:MAG: transglutaminase-like domain-containing protein [Bacteroidota bacterium]
MMKADNQLDALITLLDDPDLTVYQDVEQRILELGIQVRDELKKASIKSAHPVQRNRINILLSKINYKHVKQHFSQWLASPEKDLLSGLLIIAEYQYPELNTDQVLKKIDQIRKDAWLEINDQLTALEQVKVLNHIFFSVHRFQANSSNFYAPGNSFINDVLFAKKGNPITLSSLYAIIAQKLDIPIFGVNLPEHFILAYVDNHTPFQAKPEDILFYINVFNKGVVFTHNEVGEFLKHIKVNPKQEYFLPCTNKVIITRMLNNLIVSYDKTNKPEKAKEIKELILLTIS